MFLKSALEAFKITNPTKQLYLDFIYGALLKMKEYNAHTHLEAYRKLMEIFPIGTSFFKFFLIHQRQAYFTNY